MDVLTALCRAIFGDFDDSSLAVRLGRETDHDLWIAQLDDRPVGFKLGYRASDGVFYSWLGGLAPEARRRGIARELMRLQHAAARAAGYRFIETRTRAGNEAMAALNRAADFEAIWEETDSSGATAIRMRKLL